MMGFLSALASNPWVQRIIIPLASRIFLDLVERYRSDQQFREKINDAADLVKTAQTKEEKLDAAQKFQDALTLR